MRKYLLSLLVVLMAGMDYALAATMPTLSTPENPVLYYIRNTRSNKYAAFLSSTERMDQVASASAQSMFWFEKAGELVNGIYQPVKIHVLSTSLAMAHFEKWSISGGVWYIRQSTMDSNAFAIGLTAGNETDNGNWWNDASAAGLKVGSWNQNDGGSIWDIAAVPASELPSVTTITWNLKDGNGQVKATAKVPATAGYSYTAPFALAVNLIGQTEVSATSSNQTFDLTYTLDLSFTPSADNVTGTWYKCIMRPDFGEGPKYLHYDNPEVSVKPSNKDLNDMGSYFCFVGDVFNGFKIYNAALTSDKALGGPVGNRLTAVNIGEAPTFDLEKNVTPSRTYNVFRNHATFNGYLNDNSSFLAYWQHANAGTDWGSDWKFEPVDEALNARINTAGTITYNTKYNGQAVNTYTFRALGGENFPAVPYKKGFTATPPEGTVAGDASFDVDLVPHIKASTNVTNVTWYRIINKPNEKPLYLNYQEGADKYAMTESYDDSDNYLWAFIGDPINGYKVINKATGFGKFLSVDPANGNCPTMSTNAQVWTYDESNDPALFGLGVNGFWINNYGNANNLSLWQAGPAADGGSTLKIEEADINSIAPEGFIAISNASELKAFADRVNAGETRLNGYLTANIDYGTESTMIGADGKDFNGTFDGAGHTIKINMTATADGQAMFRNLGADALVTNVLINGTIHTNYKYACGIAAWSRGVIRNCAAIFDIESGISGDATHGGIVGVSNQNAYIENCLAKITVNGSATQNCGGIIGWTDGRSHVVNCLVINESNMNDVGGCGTIGRHEEQLSGASRNNYFLNVWGNTAKATQITAEDLANGKVAYMLNHDQASPVWSQVIGVDAYPVPFPGSPVYASAATGCDGQPSADATYSNVGSNLATAHNYAADGVCSVCGHWNYEQVKRDPADGKFVIKTGDDLRWAEHYNSISNGGYFSMKLGNDVTYTGKTIFNTGNWFEGTFDGDGNALTIELTDAPEATALFPNFSGTVKNLIMHGSISGPGKFYASIAAHARRGTTTIENVYSDVNMTLTDGGDRTSAGLLAVGDEAYKINNCVYAGTIEAIGGGDCCGGIVGWSSTSGQLNNVAMLGSLKVGTNGSNMISRNPGNANCNNVYFLPTSGIEKKGTEISADIIPTGELCYMLGSAFYQAIGTDNYPMPIAKEGAQVFKNGTLNCDGTSKSVDYANTNTGIVRDQHQLTDGYCTVCGDKNEEEDGSYALANAKDLAWFSSFVNKGHTDAVARLTADIDMTGVEYTPIANTPDVAFKGTLDGQKHTISNLKAVNPESNYMGLVGVVANGATVKNLTLDSTCEISGRAFCGLVGGSAGSGNIYLQNLGNECNVTGTQENIAGIIGVDMGSSMTFNIDNCYVTGHIKGNRESAAITGWAASSSVITNCYSIATIEGLDGGNTFFRNGGCTATNCYETAGTQVTKVTEEQIANGELAYMLNGDQSNINFYQEIGEGTIPTLNGSTIVYKVGKKDCATNEVIEGEFVFANTNELVDVHDYVNGICTKCGLADENYKEADEEGYYDLANAADVEWFSTMVNKNLKVTINGRLTADIDFEGVENAHTPIGLNTTYKFNGKFDGQGHRIMNMILNLPENENGTGFFGIIRGGTVIENLIIDKSCSITGKNRVGAIAGSAQTLVGNDTWTIIRNCVNEAPLTALNGAAAMAIGGAQSQYPLLLVDACVNTGKITANNMAAAFIGWNNSGSGPGKNSRLENCVNIGEISVLDGVNALFRGSYRAYDNNYDLVNTTTNQAVHPTWMTEDPVASGELCFYLNKQVSGGTKYYQTIGVDAYPVPFATSDIVYGEGDYKCDGSMLNITGFSNNADVVTIPDHVLVEGICAVCGMTDENHITPDADGWYHLATVGDVEWFSAMVNKNWMGGMNVKLDNDIDFGGVENAHMPIGTSAHKFYGHFDGQNHVIKGMVITESLARENADWDGWGFFGSVRGGGIDAKGNVFNNCTIENLTIDNTCAVQTNKNFVAGVVGHINNRQDNSSVITIRNCGNQANITSTGKNVAGILGCVEATTVGLVLTNCYNTGNITGSSESAAICGWTGSAADGLVKEASNCWNIGQVNGVDGNGHNLFRIPNSGIELVNCYELCESNEGVQGRDYTFATENPVSSGELAVLFNKNAGNKNLIRQELGVDYYPTFQGALEVIQTANGTIGNDFTIDTITWEEAIVDESWNDSYGNVKGTFKFCGQPTAICDGAFAFIMEKNDYEANGIYNSKHLYAAMGKNGNINFNTNGDIEMTFTCLSAGTSEPLFQKVVESNDLTPTSEFVVVIFKNAIEFNSGIYGKNMIFDNESVLNGIIDEFVATALDGNADGINNINAANEGVEIYTISGQRVQKTQKGQIYITDGKKSLK